MKTSHMCYEMLYANTNHRLANAAHNLSSYHQEPSQNTAVQYSAVLTVVTAVTSTCPISNGISLDLDT
jgi:hypothetical protein